MVWTLLVLLISVSLLLAWLFRRLAPTSGWALAGVTLIGAFLPSYIPTASAWLLSPSGHFLIWSGLDKESHPYASRFVEAFLIAAIPEEVYKFALLLALCKVAKRIHSVRDGIFLGAMLGIGHALGENCQDLKEGVRVALISGGMKLIYLAALGVIMGYFLGRAQNEEGPGRRLLMPALLVPLVLHGLFDFGYFVGELTEQYTDDNTPVPVLLGIGLMFVVWLVPILWSWRLVRKNAVQKAVAVT
jgi:RsiW-degrading membrane proteinase PrsW (M82 family)